MRLAACLVPLVLTTACSLDDLSAHRERYAGPPRQTLANGAVTVELRLDSFGLSIANGAGKVLLDTLDADPGVAGDDVHAYGALGATHRETEFQIAVIEGWDHAVGVDAPWHHATAVERALVGASSAELELFDPDDESVTLHVELELEGPEVRFAARVGSGGVDAGEAPPQEVPGALNLMGQSFVLPADEHFYGLGERFVTVDHRGRHYQSWIEEGGVGQGEDAPPGPQNPSPNGPGMTHLAVPFYLSTEGYGLWMETSYRTGFALGADDERAFRIYAAEPALRYRVLVHDDPLATLAHYTALTGRARLPAPWVFGPRRRTGLGAMALGVPETQALRDHGVPTTMVDDTKHFLPIASQSGQEAELAAWTADMHAEGYKPIAYYNAYVSVSDERAADLVAYGRAHDYFVKLADGSEFQTLMFSAGAQTVATIDMTNPEAVAWYQSLLDTALGLGYDGWMLDFGEYLPAGARMHDGRTGWEVHNEFPVLYQKATAEHLRAVRGDDWMYFARAGYTGAQQYAPVTWSGDPAASFDDAKGLPANLRAGINAGLTGFPFWGSDISGYTCNQDVADKEVYLRWAELGALSSDMHDENACSNAPPGAPPKWTLWSDQETIDVYGRYARLHTRLFPYLYAAAEEATLTGIPVMRHPVLYYPAEAGARAVELEYFFGPSLYVAPVVRRDAVTRELWLPPGLWVDWWTNEVVNGGSVVTRPAPLDTLPMLLRSGGIVALLDPSVETLAPRTAPGVVSLYDVLDVLDVRAAIDPAVGSGHAALVDGSVLDVALSAGAVALPTGFTLAADDAELASCTGCGRIDALPGGAERVRLTGALATEETLVAGGLVVRRHGVTAQRMRWDVVVVGGG
ncbi:MAG: glycoside hydrolase family 31 protein [Polyangiaceae bacterium]|nr:glycoside hydrolase family 31 protein [Polyangiaceae bacterium]